MIEKIRNDIKRKNIVSNIIYADIAEIERLCAVHIPDSHWLGCWMNAEQEGPTTHEK